MAVVIDETVSGPNANSWVGAVEFDTYITERSHASAAVIASTPTVRANALALAVRLIIQLTVWDPLRISMSDDGRVVPAVTSQRLILPALRMSSRASGTDLPTNVTPEFVKLAQMEEAISLIDSDRLADAPTRGISSVKVDVIDLKFDGEQSQTRVVLSEQSKRELSFWALAFGDESDSSGEVRSYTPDGYAGNY